MGCLKLEILKDYKPTLRVVGKNPETEKKCVNCYPFGMNMPGRTFNSSEYRYGFNGMEKDDEIKGEGNSLDFGARIYDPRLGRWLSEETIFRGLEMIRIKL
jgi:RHS repeat-associated protein